MRGWKKLVEIASVRYGRHFSTLLITTEGTPLVRVGDVVSGKANNFYTGPIPSPPMKYLVKRGDIVVSMSGYFTVNRWNDSDALLDLRVMRIRGKHDSSDTDYLFHYLQPVFKHIEDTTEGHRTKNLTAKQVNEIEVFLPTFKEQQRIAEVLNAHTDAIDELKTQIALGRQQLVEERQRLFNIPGVATTTIGGICLKVHGGGTPPTNHPEYYRGDIPWLRTQEIDWNEVTDTEVKISSEALQHSQAELIPAGCVIVAMYGATAGKAAINRIPLSTNQACCNLEVDTTRALPEYVFHYLAREHDHLKSLGEGPRGNLNASKIKGHPIPLPSLEEQRRIVAAIDTFNNNIAALERQVATRIQQYENERDQLMSFPTYRAPLQGADDPGESLDCIGTILESAVSLYHFKYYKGMQVVFCR